MHALLEVIVTFVLEVVLQLVFRVPGVYICKLLKPDSSTSSEGCLVAIVGLIFWGIVVVGICLLIR